MASGSFIAEVIAELNTQQAQAKLNAFKNGKHKIDIDVNLVSKNGNINNILNQIKSQFGQAGSAAGNNFANQVNSTIGNINTNNATNTIRNLQRTLAGFKFDRSQINTITQSLESMDVAVQKVDTRIRRGGILDLRVTGVDELGRTVTILKQFDSTTGTLTNLGKNISQIFNGADISKFNVGISKLNADITALDANFVKLKGSANQESVALAQLKSDLAGISNIDGLNRQQAEFDRITNEVKRLSAAYKEAKAENAALTASQQLLTNKSILGNQIETWMNKNTKAAKIYRNELELLQRNLANVSNGSQLKAITNSFNSLKATAAASGNLGVSVLSRLKSNLTSLSPLFGMGALISTSIRGLKDMYNNVLNIDTAMTELKKVTNESADAYDKFLNTASKRASEIGTTITDYINSTADFARLGYSMDEAKELAEVANIYSVVGDEIASIDDASASIISTIQAFGIQAQDAISIVDKFNEVGNRFAISSGGIGEAMTRSASSMFAAGNTLDQTIALITAANTVVQDPASVGTAFKTISMRIRGAKTELEEAGLETEGMVESTAKLREEIMALSGVDIMLDDNTFKSTYQILEELAGKWQDLTDIQQASITELIAGKRQGNIISALMNNFDIAQDALQVSLDSEGSAMKEHERWMESLQAKVNQLKAAWESLSNSFLSSGFVKGGVDGLTALVQTIDLLIQKLGTLPTLFATISATLSAFKNVGRDKMFSLIYSINMPTVYVFC